MIQALGWTLIHFLWQGTAIAVLLAVANRALRHASAQARYVVACAALLLMFAAPVATFLRFSHSAVAPTTLAAAPPVQISDVAVPPASPSGPPPGELPWLPLIVAVWAAGVALLSVRMAGGVLVARRLKLRATPVTNREWEERIGRLVARLGLRRGVALRESLLAEAPMTIGWLKPAILIPAGALLRLSPEQMEAILAHELAHVRRFDYLVNLLQTGVETLLFYHPAVWWVGRRIRAERENCCDDLAVAVCGDAVEYARALVELETLAAGRTPQMALAATGTSLPGRVKRLLQARRETRRNPETGLMAVLIVLAVATTWFCVQPRLHAASHAAEAAATTLRAMPGQQAIAATGQAAGTPKAPAKQMPEPAPSYLRLSGPNKIVFETPVVVKTTGAQRPSSDQVIVFNTPAVVHVTDLSRSSASNPIVLRRLPEPSNAREAGSTGNGMAAFKEAKVLHVTGLTSPVVVHVVMYKQNAGQSGPSVNSNASKPQATGTTKIPPPPPPPPAPATAQKPEASYVKEMADAGYPHLSTNELIAFKTQGITPEYIRGIRAAGFAPSANQLLAMRVMSVTPEYAKQMKAAFPAITARELIACHTQGIDPETARQMNGLGLGKLSVQQMIAARIFKIDAAAVRSLQSEGFQNLTFQQVIAARVQNVTPEFVRGLKAAGFMKLTLRQTIAARVQGLTPEYVKSLKSLGFPQLTFDEALRAKVMGLTPEFVREARRHGFQNLTIDKLIRLKMLDVLPAH